MKSLGWEGQAASNLGSLQWAPHPCRQARQSRRSGAHILIVPAPARRAARAAAAATAPVLLKFSRSSSSSSSSTRRNPLVHSTSCTKELPNIWISESRHKSGDSKTCFNDANEQNEMSGSPLQSVTKRKILEAASEIRFSLVGLNHGKDIGRYSRRGRRRVPRGGPKAAEQHPSQRLSRLPLAQTNVFARALKLCCPWP